MSEADEDVKMGRELAQRTIDAIKLAKGRTKANARHAHLAERMALHLGETAWGWLRQVEELSKEVARLEYVLHKANVHPPRNTDGSLASEETAA